MFFCARQEDPVITQMRARIRMLKKVAQVLLSRLGSKSEDDSGLQLRSLKNMEDLNKLIAEASAEAEEQIQAEDVHVCGAACWRCCCYVSPVWFAHMGAVRTPLQALDYIRAG